MANGKRNRMQRAVRNLKILTPIVVAFIVAFAWIVTSGLLTRPKTGWELTLLFLGVFTAILLLLGVGELGYYLYARNKFRKQQQREAEGWSAQEDTDR